jgi:hypothetical protein
MLWWDGEGEFTWEWILDPIDDQTTRLVTRVQAAYPPLPHPPTPMPVEVRA